MTENFDAESSPPYIRDKAFWGMTKTQFLGAFNDNVFKQLVMLLCIAYVTKIAAEGDVWQPIAQAAFALPFILFSGLGGFLADRYCKRRIVVACKVAEIVVMLCGTAALWFLPPGSRDALIALCSVLFLMGAQSAFFGPAKYGILPEMLRERDLPAANGLIQMTTFLAIIFGTVLAGQCVVRFRQDLWMVTTICVAIAVAGTITALLVRRTPIAQPDAKFSLDALWMNRDTRDLLRQDRPLLNALLISTLFWFLGGAVIPAVNGFGEFTLKLGEDRTSVMAAMMGVGIAIGCPIAGVLSKGAVRFGLVRLGAFGIFVALMVLGASVQIGSRWAERDIGRMDGVQLEAAIRAANLPDAADAGTNDATDKAVMKVNFLLEKTKDASELVSRWSLGMLGFFGGLFAVPLQVFLQSRPPKQQKGRMIGSMNLVNWIGILLAAVFHLITTSIFGKGTPVSFVVLGFAILPVALFFRPSLSK